MSVRSVIAMLATSLFVLALFALLPGTLSEAPLTEKAALEKFLNEHPYANRTPVTKQELKAIPKAERPDLAIEQDFLRTLDLETRSIPVERLFEANQTATDYKRSAERGGGGPLVTEAWVERGPTNIGGRTRGIMFDPNDENNLKVWAGGVAGGLWYKEDITALSDEWIGVNDFWSNLAISTLTYDPTDTQVFYAGTGEGWFNVDAVRGAGIFKSDDGGDTWALLPSTDIALFRYVQDILVHPTTGDVYATTREGGLQRSQDDGATWEAVLSSSSGAVSTRASDLEIGADGMLYVSFGIFSLGAIYKSSTGDLNDWTRITGGSSGFPSSGISRVDIATAPSNAGVLYAVTQSSGNNGIQNVYRSNDAGDTWTATTFPSHPTLSNPARNQAWYDLIIEVAPDNEEIVYVGSIDFQRSTNGGDSWEVFATGVGAPGVPGMHVDQHNMVFRPGAPNEAVFANDGGVYYSADLAARDISVADRGYNVTQYYSAALSPDEGSDFMLGGTQDNGTHRFSQDGVGSISVALGGDGAFSFIDQDQPALAIASTQFVNYFRSTNGGITFPTNILNESFAGASFINPADYDDREDILFANRSSGSFYRVTDVLAGPSASTISLSMGAPATHLRVSPYAPEGTSTVYLGTGAGKIFRVANAQATPEAQEVLTAPVVGAISCIEIGASEDQLLVTVSNYGLTSVWETMDGGQTWNNKEGDLPDIPVRWALYSPADRRAAIIATEAGVWETVNLEADEPTWTPAPGFPTARTDMLQWRTSDNRVMASTHGRGVFTATFSSSPPVSIEEAVPSAETHTLDAAYPNPFADRATVGLRVAQAQDVRVEVFNAIGQRVAVLHEGALAAETPYRFTLESQDLASGTYLYVVTGETFKDEGRMTLVR
ncbi:MAG: T9SS type A sorting domain-containing protein [Bacteroidota bacterium]